jgi:hypothetical protein
LGAILVVAPAVTTTVHAQPGFGPDPFWPYNSQYAPYTNAVGPASPDGGQGNSFVPRQGYNTANQFQQYLDDMGNPGRNVSDRAGVGVPYYRGSVDPSFGDREYRPNARSNKDFENTQRDINEKYFQYFSERDPRKRAELLREYQRARRESSRNLGSRAQSPSRDVAAAPRVRPEAGSSRESSKPRGAMSASVSLPYEPGTSRAGPAGSSRAQGRTLRPAPPVPTIAPSTGGGRSRATTPSSILDRARGLDGRGGRAPSSTSAAPRGGRSGQRSGYPTSRPPE